MFTLKDFTGVIPALITPYDKRGDYDPKCSKEMVDWLVSMGVGGFYLTGTNGTGFFMDSDERIRAVDTITAQVGGRVPVTAHIAAVSTKASAKMAKEAQASGCTAVSAVPSYVIYLGMEDMMQYYGAIADASELPLIVYAQTSVYTPSVEMFQKLATIERVQGVKFTGSDHYMLGRIKEHLGKDFLVYSGRDEMMLSGLLYGADAVIGGTYNVLPDLYIRCKGKLEQEDINGAMKDMLLANAIVEIMASKDTLAAIRACFTFLGIDAGYSPAPFKDFDEFERAAFKKELQELKSRTETEPFALFDAI